jgi:membrane protease YdiL (CAAX protease family)
VDKNASHFRSLIVFLSVAMGGSVLLSVAIGLSGGQQSPLARFAVLSMFMPALGVMVTRLTVGDQLNIKRARSPLLWVPVALLLVPLAIHAVALPGVLLLEGRLPWDAWLTPGRDGLYHAPAQLGWEAVTLSGLLEHIAVNAVIGLLVVTFLSIFEEVGWRAFMLPRLVDLYGSRRGAVASAVIFALWHVPYALSGVQHVVNVSPLALALVSPIGQVGAGLFLAFLWLKTRSLLLVSLAHGSLNNWGQYAFKFMKTSGERDLTLFAMVNLALLVLGAGALALTPRSDVRSFD